MDFQEAQNFVAQNSSIINQQDLLQCYGLYKAATIGPCNIPKPAFYEFERRAKWEAWSSLGQISVEDAKKCYIEAVKKIGLKSASPNSTGSTDPTSTGVSVSTMTKTDVVDNQNRTIFDLTKEGNFQDLQKFELLSNHVDENKMTILHWAADRGHVEIIEHLVNLGFDCNLQDLEGSTPLHHAAYSGNKISYAALVKGGARSDIENLDGETPHGLINS